MLILKNQPNSYTVNQYRRFLLVDKSWPSEVSRNDHGLVVVLFLNYDSVNNERMLFINHRV